MDATIEEMGDVRISFPENEAFIDVEHYRKLVRTYMDLRRYQTALFWAEKVVVMTKGDPKDIYWQAQCMFLLGEYHRAAYIIRVRELEKKHILCHYLTVESLLKAKEYQEALNILTSVAVEDLTLSITNDKSTTDELGLDEYSKNEIIASIYFLKGKVFEAMDNRNLAMDCYVEALQKSVYCTEALDSLVEHEMLLAWEEKELMQHLPISQQCTDAEAKILKRLYETKLKKYYQTVEATTNPEHTPVNMSNIKSIRELSDKLKFQNSSDMRMGRNSSKFLTPHHNIMSPANKILNDLKNTPSYSIQSSLSRISMINESNKNIDTSKRYKQSRNNCPTLLNLTTSFERLQSSIDILISKSEKYFHNCDYKKCLKILDEVWAMDPYHTGGLTIQIGCLVEMKDYNKLFYLAHKLVDLYSDQAISWYAVGCYYDLIGKSDLARRYLSKATTLDRLYGPAWLAYGHSFAKEKEHDQAMAAYFKATQLMRGCHLPLLYIGVECGLTKNLELAEKFFYQAMSIAPLDVYVLHELGVIKFEYEDFEGAEEILRTTLSMVTQICKQNGESLSARWEPLLNNLGHCCRKNKKYEDALQFHRRALVLKPQSSQTYTAIGFIQAITGQLESAVESFHKSLSLKRDNIVTTTILKNVIEELMEDSIVGVSLTESSDEMDLTPIKTTPDSPIKNTDIICTKLIYDECDANPSPGSDNTSVNMSLEL